MDNLNKCTFNPRDSFRDPSNNAKQMKRISVGMIKSDSKSNNKSINKTNHTATTSEHDDKTRSRSTIKTNSVTPPINLKLSDRLMDSDIEALLGEGVDYLEGDFMYNIKDEPFEMNNKIDNCFTQIISSGDNFSGEDINSPANHTNAILTDNNINFNKNAKFLSNNPNKYLMRGSFADTILLTSKNKGKLMFSTVKEKKDYQEKINSINNRIKKLKEQEEEMKCKVKRLKSAADKDEGVKIRKTEMKEMYSKAKQNEVKKMEEQKELIFIEKVKRDVNIEKVKKEIASKNKKTFDIVKKEKRVLEGLISQYKNKICNLNNLRNNKTKTEILEWKNLRQQKKVEKDELTKNQFEMKMDKEGEEREKLRRKLKELENAEEQCMESLKKTMKNTSEQFAMFSGVAKKLRFGHVRSNSAKIVVNRDGAGGVRFINGKKV